MSKVSCAPREEPMRFQERANVITELLQKQQVVSAAELGEKLKVSLVTIRKDLQRLEDEGKLIRTFGGAASCTVDYKEQQRLSAMQRIADCVMGDIEEGDCIIMNAGNTTLLSARNMLRLKQLKVITNSISIARELSKKDGFQLILLGGEMSAGAVFTHGAEAIGQLEQYKANKLILSASGISFNRGLTTRHMEAAALFQKMIARSKEIIVVVDDTKIGFESFYFVDGLHVVNRIVTNASESSEEELRRMEQTGIEVCRC